MAEVIVHELKGMTSEEFYASGGIKSCKFTAYNEIYIGNQIYVPRYKKIDERKKDNQAVTFYENGNIKSIALEAQTEITTSVGVISAELITFYEDGMINSVFPLNGQIGFGWSEEEEEKLLKEMTVTLPFGQLKEKFIGIRFYHSGSLKSLILWPKKIINLSTPLGEYPVRIGFRLYEDGLLESFEPAVPITLNCKIGPVVAFDQNALGMDADINSVGFYPDGTLKTVKTNSDIVVNAKSTEVRRIIYQQFRLDEITGKLVKVPVSLFFEEEEIIIDNGAEKNVYSIEDSKFLLLHDNLYMEKKCSPGSDCSDCGAACL